MNDPVATPNFSQPNVYGPITAGQLYERTFGLLRDNFRLFFGIVLVAIGVEIVVSGVLGLGGMWSGRTGGASYAAKAVFLAPLALVGGVLVYVMTQIVQGALFFATQSRLAGRSIHVGEACRMALDKVGTIVGISVLVALRMLGYLLLIYFGLAVALFIVATIFGGVTHFAGQFTLRGPSAPTLGTLAVLALFGLVFFAIYLVCIFWLIARYSVSVPACLEEDLGATDAIRRSIRLTAKGKGRIYAALLGAFFAWMAITAVTVPFQVMAAATAARTHSISPATVGLLSLLLGAIRIVFSGFVIAFLGVATALCYYDLRSRKEGFGNIPPQVVPVISPIVPPDIFPSASADLPS